MLGLREAASSIIDAFGVEPVNRTAYGLANPAAKFQISITRSN